MWPFSTPVDPALSAAARAAGGAAAASPVDAVRASMGGAAGGGLRAAATRYGVPGAALGFAIEAASPGAATQADLEARRADLQGRRGLDYTGAFIRNLSGAAVNAAYEGTVAPVARAGGDFIRGLTGGRAEINMPPAPSASQLEAGRQIQAAAMAAADERRPPAAAAGPAARAAGGTPYGGLNMEQAVASLPPGLNRQQALPLLERMIIRPTPEQRRPTGRDVLAYRADALLQQELQALEQARTTGALSQPDYARQRGSVLQRYLSTLGTNPVNDAVAAAMQEAR